MAATLSHSWSLPMKLLDFGVAKDAIPQETNFVRVPPQQIRTKASVAPIARFVLFDRGSD
eukprot:3674897-Amphidinium_carterae.1